MKEKRISKKMKRAAASERGRKLAIYRKTHKKYMKKRLKEVLFERTLREGVSSTLVKLVIRDIYNYNYNTDEKKTQWQDMYDAIRFITDNKPDSEIYEDLMSYNNSRPQYGGMSMKVGIYRDHSPFLHSMKRFLELTSKQKRYIDKRLSESTRQKDYTNWTFWKKYLIEAKRYIPPQN